MAEFSVGCKTSQRILMYVMGAMEKKQKDVAAILGVSFSFISRVFHGNRSFTLEHIEQLSAGIGLAMPVLVWRALKPTRVSKRGERALDEIDQLFKEVYPEEFKAK